MLICVRKQLVIVSTAYVPLEAQIALVILAGQMQVAANSAASVQQPST